MVSLQKSESVRRDIEYTLERMTKSSKPQVELGRITDLNGTKALRVGNEQAGLVFNLSDNMPVLETLNEQLEIINHAS